MKNKDIKEFEKRLDKIKKLFIQISKEIEEFYQEEIKKINKTK